MTFLYDKLIPSILNNSPIDFEESEYNDFLVNRSLSGYIDCILHANEMNICRNLTNKMRYDYYINTINKKKRTSNYYKYKESEDILLVKEYFNCSTEKAKEYLRILSIDQIRYIKDIINKGG